MVWTTHIHSRHTIVGTLRIIRINIAPNRSFSYVGIDTSIFHEPFKHSGTIFVDLKPSEQSSLIHKLGCIDTPESSSIFGQYIFPSIEREIAAGGAGFMPLFRFCLNRSGRMDLTMKQKLKCLACIPVSRGASSETTYLPASKIVDPESPIACLYDQDEGRFPNKDVSVSEMDCLRRLGILCTLTMEIIKDRVEKYSTWEESNLSSLVPKVKDLLSMSPTARFNMEFAWTLRWIPAHQSDGRLTLCSPNSCRDATSGRILHYVMPIAKFHTHQDWRLLLGWDQPPSKDLRRAQLEGCLKHKDRTSIIKLAKKGYLDDLISDISDQRWVFGKSEEFYRPRDLVMAGASGLRPYVDDIHEDFKFLNEKLGIKPFLSKEQVRSFWLDRAVIVLLNFEASY